MVRTSLGTFTTFLTLGSVNMGTMASHLDRTKVTCVDTCLSDTVLAVVGYNITGDRAIFTCRTDDLDDIAVVMHARCLSLCQADSLADNFSFFIDTATELRCWSRNQRLRNAVPLLFQFICKC